MCALINDPVDGACPLVVTNDTRKPVKGSVTVTDVKGGKVVFKGEYEVEANSRVTLARLPLPGGQGVLKIAYTGKDGEKLQNHYLYGEAPFNLKEYKALLKKSGMFEVK